MELDDDALGKVQHPLAHQQPRQASHGPEVGKGPLRMQAQRQPGLPPDRISVIGRQRLSCIGPERFETCHPQGPDGVDQLAVVARRAVDVGLVVDVFADQLFEMRELAFGHKNGGQYLVITLSDVHQLDALLVSGQTFGCERDSLLTLELDLDAEGALHIERLQLCCALLLLDGHGCELRTQVLAVQLSVFGWRCR